MLPGVVQILILFVMCNLYFFLTLMSDNFFIKLSGVLHGSVYLAGAVFKFAYFLNFRTLRIYQKLFAL